MEQLTVELERLGCQSGPITDTTRTVYSRQLQRLSRAAATASTHSEDTEDKGYISWFTVMSCIDLLCTYT